MAKDQNVEEKIPTDQIQSDARRQNEKKVERKSAGDEKTRDGVKTKHERPERRRAVEKFRFVVRPPENVAVENEVKHVEIRGDATENRAKGTAARVKAADEREDGDRSQRVGDDSNLRDER